MKRKIVKIGDSLVVRLPHEYLTVLGWTEGTEVEVLFGEGEILIKRRR